MPDSQTAPVRVDSRSNGAAPAPIVIDLGKKKRKQVKQLRQGQGKLVATVEDVVAGLRERGQVAADAQPIIVVVERRSRSQRFLF